MKKLTYSVLAVAGLLIASASQASAGSSGCCASSGSGCSGVVAASPKLQAALDDRCNSKCAAPAQGSQTTASAALLNGSPRTRSQKANVAATNMDAPVATFKVTGDDGITASPKLRSQLDERRQTVQIAPLK